MQAQIKLGHLFGVEIGLHYSWFLIALLIMFSLSGHFYTANPEWGGVAHIEKETVDPSTEFWIGIVGPIASVVIGGICLMLAWAFGWEPMAPVETPLMAMFVWLGYINIALAIFNMIPGFPLDGGRVLRAIVWRITGNAKRSTRIAAGVGQVVALAFIAFGIVRFFAGAGFGGLWLAFIGWLSTTAESPGSSRPTRSKKCRASAGPKLRLSRP
jgi:Zn-dependent protease